VIYWFTGASMQAVTTGAYRAVEFIKKNIKLDERDRRRRSTTRRRSWRSAPSTPRRGCSTSSWCLLLDAGVRVRRAVLLHRLPDLDRAVRALSRRSSWPTPVAPGTTPRRSSRRAEGEGDAAARRDRRRRHGRRPVQGHVVGGHEPGHQVHDPLRPAGVVEMTRRSSPPASSPSRCSSSTGASTACASTAARRKSPATDARQRPAARAADAETRKAPETLRGLFAFRQAAAQSGPTLLKQSRGRVAGKK
jgi:hypothetical protein